MMNDTEITTIGVVAACAIYVVKTMWDTFLKGKGQKGACSMTAADNLLILQTHEIAVETQKLLTQHFNELSNVASSIKDLATSISDCRNEDSKTQRQQTQILERLTDVISNQ